MTEDKKTIVPKVREDREFLEIAGDFGDPLEVLREAISNCYDAGATKIDITFDVVPRNGMDMLRIEIVDDGKGMTYDELAEKFWDLGNSSHDGNDANVIGEKGHGTKIYLRSSRIEVITHHESGSWMSSCDEPMADLVQGKIHRPVIAKIDKESSTGTKITLYGYNNNEMSRFRQEIVVDYMYWYTKLGSFEKEFEGKTPREFVVNLKALNNKGGPITYAFGHQFGTINDDIDALFKQKLSDAADWFVKRYRWSDVILDKYPHITCDIVIYIEGDKAKRQYNHMLRTTGPVKQGAYKVNDRYGIWLAKDFIPIQMKNEWVKGFGTGSNSVTLLHGFVNCQEFRLAANRGAIANAKPDMMSEIQRIVEEKISSIDTDISEQGIFTLFQWQREERSLATERADYEKRCSDILARPICKVKHEKYGEILLEKPNYESELYGLLIKLEMLYPKLFPFDMLDYYTARGIDVIGRTKTSVSVSESELKYVELKNYLGKEFNHSFENLGWVVCWDFSAEIKNETVIRSVTDENWKILFHNNNGERTYFLDNPGVKVNKIEVIRLREYLKQELSVEFKEP